MSYIIKSKKLSVLALILGLIPVSTHSINLGHLLTRTNAKRAGYTVGALATAAAATGLGWLAYKNPGYAQITAGTAGLLSLGYLYNCRTSNAHIKTSLEETRKKTQFMKDVNGIPSNKYCYWRLHKIDKKKAYTFWDLMDENLQVKIGKKLLKKNIKGFDSTITKSQHTNKYETLKRIQEEINTLSNQYKELQEALKTCYFFPPLNDEPSLFQKILLTVFPKRDTALTGMILLSRGEFERVNELIEDYTHLSILRPDAIVRSWALRYERDLLKESWNLYQLIGRLHALRRCVEAVK